MQISNQHLDVLIKLARHLKSDPLLEINSLIELIEQRSLTTPQQTAIVFENEQINYKTLWQNINNFAFYLENMGVKSGDTVIIKMPNSISFFFAFYGILRIGGIAVPTFCEASDSQLAKVANACKATALITEHKQEEERVNTLNQQVKQYRFLHLNMRNARHYHGEPKIATLSMETLAMLQYTSGTTGDPKGVMLTHGNLLTNIRQMILAAQLLPTDVFVSWLPLYHDMGLITMSMCPFYLGAKLVLLPVSPMPHKWLNAIQEHKGTMTAAPDFGYRFCTKFSKSNAQYDISTLKCALIAAEPVRASTIKAFEEKFGLQNVVRPGYGLAEVSVAATFWDTTQEKIKVDDAGNVSVGKPIDGVDLRIAKFDFLPKGEVGEIVVKSLSGTSGYFNNERATNDLFFQEEFIKTGDLGYIDQDGDLFIVGRSKNIIIKGGRNISPKELEEELENFEGIRLSAALGIPSQAIEGEEIIVFVELEAQYPTDETSLSQMRKDISQHIYSVLGYRPDKILITPPKTIPKTYNGKLMYNSLRYSYLNEKIEVF